MASSGLSLATFVLRPEDVTELAAFYSRQTGEASGAILERLTWLCSNPARRDDIPFGWGVRDAAGLIVGALLCVPYRYTIGSDVEWFAMSSAYYVDPTARGAGVPLFLQLRSLDRVVFASTTNTVAAAVWRSGGGRPIAKTEYEWLYPTRWGPAVEDTLATRVGASARLLALPVALLDGVRHVMRSRGTTLTRVDRAEDAVVDMPPASPVDLVRDAAFLTWRYFSIPQNEAGIFRFTSDRPRADGYVGVTTARRGYRGQIRCVYQADVWGQVPPDAVPWLLDALTQATSDRADLISLRSQPDDYERAAAAAGFRRRPFANPVGWYIDRRRALPVDWRLIPAGSEIV